MVSTNRVGLLVIGAGIVMALSPVLVFSADIGAPTYEFEATELSYENGSFQYSQPMTGTYDIENIACAGESRVCKLERHVYEEGRLPAADADVTRGYYEFAYLNGSFFRTEMTEEAGTVFLTHEPVSADAALSGSSTSYGIAAPAYRRAVDQGHATTTERLDTTAVVSRTDDRGNERFYYVYATTTPPAGEHGPDIDDRIVTFGLSCMGFLVGVALIGRGQRIRVRSQMRR